MSKPRTNWRRQAEHTAFLETVLRVERETAEAKIKELTEKLEDERLQRTATEQVSAAMRQEMAALLRQFATRRHLHDAGQRRNAPGLRRMSADRNLTGPSRTRWLRQPQRRRPLTAKGKRRLKSLTSR